MDVLEDTMSSKDLRFSISPATVKKSKKRSLVERELETNLTEKITTPIVNSGSNSSRYGRKRYLISDSEFDNEKSIASSSRPTNTEKTPIKVQSPVYRMYASNSPIRSSPKLSTSQQIRESLSPKIENQIKNIYNENQSLSRFSAETKTKEVTQNRSAKVYMRQDLIQSREKEKDEPLVLIRNLFSPTETYKSPRVHIEDILARPSIQYTKNLSLPFNKDNSSVVKTLDFDDNKNRKDKRERKTSFSKSEIFDMEANCEYQVGDIAWARVGTYPFWPCIVTRDPSTGVFVKKKLFGRIERDIIHVTFFGDNGRRGWIVVNMLRKYKGKNEFEATRESFTPQIKRRDPRLYAAFFVSDKKQALWNMSVEEAETLLKEPKRLRIDLLNSMLEKYREARVATKREKSAKVNRTNSDVSLSESLYDTLFSETDERSSDADKTKRKSRNPSLDVSEVVTACLDDMAAKTGISSIKRQSHMDRWLQKAKSNTPEKISLSQAGKNRERSKTRQGTTRGSSRVKLNESNGLLKNNVSYQSDSRNSECQSALIFVDSDSNTNSDTFDDSVTPKRCVSVLDVDISKREDHNYCKSLTKPNIKENNVKDVNLQIKHGNQCDRRTRSKTHIYESNYNNDVNLNDEPHKVDILENGTKNDFLYEINLKCSKTADNNDLDKFNVSSCQGLRSDKIGKSRLKIVTGNPNEINGKCVNKDDSITQTLVDNITYTEFQSGDIDNNEVISEHEIINDSMVSKVKRDNTKFTEEINVKNVMSDEVETKDKGKSVSELNKDNELSIDEILNMNNEDENSMTFTPEPDIEVSDCSHDKHDIPKSCHNEDKMSIEEMFLMNNDDENSMTCTEDQDVKSVATSSSHNKQNSSKSCHNENKMSVDEMFLMKNDDENSMTFTEDQDVESVATSSSHIKQNSSKSFHNENKMSIDEMFLMNNDDKNSMTFTQDEEVESVTSSSSHKENLSKSCHNEVKMSKDESFFMNNDDENSMTLTQDQDIESLTSSSSYNKENLSKSCHNEDKMLKDESFLMNNDDENSMTLTQDQDVESLTSSSSYNKENLSKICHNEDKMLKDDSFLMNNGNENNMTFTQDQDVENLISSSSHNKENLSKSCHNEDKMLKDESFLMNNDDENSMTLTQDQDVESLTSSSSYNNKNLSKICHNEDKMLKDDSFLMNNDNENNMTFTQDQDVENLISSSSHNKENLLKSCHNEDKMLKDESFLMNNDDENSMTFTQDQDVENITSSSSHYKENLSKSCHNEDKMLKDESFLMNNDDKNSMTFTQDQDVESLTSSSSHNKENLSKSCPKDRQISINESVLRSNDDENSTTFTQDQDVESVTSTSSHNKENLSKSCHNEDKMLKDESFLMNNDDENSMTFKQDQDIESLTSSSSHKENLSKSCHNEVKMSKDESFFMNNDDENSMTLTQDQDIESLTSSSSYNKENLSKSCHNEDKMLKDESFLLNNGDENSMTFTQDQDVEILDSSKKFNEDQNLSQNSEGEMQIVDTDRKIREKKDVAKNVGDQCVKEQSNYKKLNESLAKSHDSASLNSTKYYKIRMKVKCGQRDLSESDNIAGNKCDSPDNIKESDATERSYTITNSVDDVTIKHDGIVNTSVKADAKKEILNKTEKDDLRPNNQKKSVVSSSINNENGVTTDLEPIINFELDKITSDECTIETMSTDKQNKRNSDLLFVVNHMKLRNRSVETDGNGSEIILKPDKTALKSEHGTSTRRGLQAKNRISLKEQQFNSKQESDFINYLESKQDTLLEENPELTQEEVKKYLYNTWLYEKDKKSNLIRANDLKSSNLVNCLNQNNVVPIKKNKKSSEIAPAKKEGSSKVKLQLNGSIKKYLKSVNHFSNEIQSPKTLQIEVEEGVAKSKNVIEHEIDNNENNDTSTNTKLFSSCSKTKMVLNGHTESIESRSEKTMNQECDPKTNSISCEPDVSSVKEGTYQLQSHQEDPEFVSYLELKQDVLIEENPELTYEDIVKYLYKTWLYEISNKTKLQEKNTNKTNVSNQDTVSSANYEADKVDLDKKIIFDDFKCTYTSNENKTAETVKVEKDESSINSDTEKNDLNCEDRLVNVDNSETIPAKVIGLVNSNEASLETMPKQERDSETIASSSQVNITPSTKRRVRAKNEKSIRDTKNTDKFEPNVLEDPEFVNYMELKQDALVEENPDLTRDEIVKYLCKTWLYETSNKSELKRNEDIEQLTLVKGLNQDAVIPAKKYKKKTKIEKAETQKTADMEIVQLKDNAVEKSNEKPKRRIAKACYNEDFFDFDTEFKMFEIFRKNKNKIKNSDETKIAEVIDVFDEAADDCVIDDEEVYFEELTTPKPNLFKGLIREKVCEICESPSDLVKCKGCHCFFHVACIKKELETFDTPGPNKGKRKYKKKRGRRPKDRHSVDSECNSDDKTEDASVSDEINVSFEEIDSESHIVVDADNFEAHFSAKMKELLENTDPIRDYEWIINEGQLNWKTSVAGKCEIVDVKSNVKSPLADTENLDFKCNNCQKYDVPVCCVCRSNLSPKNGIEFRQRCQVAHCHRYYHLECLDHWPQTQFSSGGPSKNNKKMKDYFENITCPRHVCHTCVCDDPRGCKTRFSGDKLARCVRCPATYHSFTKCLPAGSQILTGSHIICPRHIENRPGKVPCHVNTGWCFICTLGGTLICCEYCPTSFHAECLNIEPPDGGYMCEDCETGRLPLYGEMVWVKLGHYRWWPGIILHPCQIPANVMAVKHSQGEFVVRFFGQYDHYWVNRGRVFPFQEDDTGKVSSQKSKINADFNKAIEHAKRACEILKNVQENVEEQVEISSSLLPPHYVKLKTNKPVGGVSIKRDEEGESLTQCNCDPNQEDPCGPLTQCLNRMLMTECGPTCRAGERCNNRAFEKRQYPRLEPYRTPQRGWGLRTLDFIPQGQFVIEYVGELLDEEEFRRRMRRKHDQRDENYYFLILDKERMIDAGPKGNLARFMNHCCEPNCETQKWTVLGDVRVGLFALCDIPENSEVTFNYNLVSAGIEKKRCLCGAKRCSGYIGAKPKQESKIVPKKSKFVPKRTYQKRKIVELSPTTSKSKPKTRTSRVRPKELTEIEKDLLIIKNATNSLGSDREESDDSGIKERTAQKRKRVSFSTEEKKEEPSLKKTKTDV